MFSKKATKIDEILTADLTLCSKCQIDGEDFVIFCGLLRKHELYQPKRKGAQGRDLAPIFGDLSRSEKLPEIKPPLGNFNS